MFPEAASKKTWYFSLASFRIPSLCSPYEDLTTTCHDEKGSFLVMSMWGPIDFLYLDVPIFLQIGKFSSYYFIQYIFLSLVLLSLLLAIPQIQKFIHLMVPQRFQRLSSFSKECLCERERQTELLLGDSLS